MLQWQIRRRVTEPCHTSQCSSGTVAAQGARNTCRLPLAPGHEICHRATWQRARATQKPTAQVQKMFRFRRFELRHDICGMKMGTDAMLLGSFVRPSPDTAYILDVGTGSGVLALMAAQRAPLHACIHAIDVDEAACRQAAANAAASPWAGRVHVYHMGLQDLVEQQGLGMGTGMAEGHVRTVPDEPHRVVECTGQAPGGCVLPASMWHCPPGGYNLIVSNPPYFVNSYLPPPSEQGGTTASPPTLLRAEQCEEALTNDVVGDPTLPPSPASQSKNSAHTPSTVTQNSPTSTSASSLPGSPPSTPSQNVLTSSLHGSDPAAQGVPAASLHGSDPTVQRILARHAGAGAALTHAALAAGAAALLAAGGQLCVVLPVDEGQADRFAALAHAQGLTLVRCLQVYATTDSPNEKRRLMQFVRRADPAQPHPPHQDHSKSVLEQLANRHSAQFVTETPLGQSNTAGSSSNVSGLVQEANVQGVESHCVSPGGLGLSQEGCAGMGSHGVVCERLAIQRSSEEMGRKGKGSAGQPKFTDEYLRLTWDYHEQSFFDKMKWSPEPQAMPDH